MMRRHRAAIDEARRTGKGVIDDEVLASVAGAEQGTPEVSGADEGGAEATGQEGGQGEDLSARIAALEGQLAERDDQIKSLDGQVKGLQRDVKTRDGKIARLEKAAASPAKKTAEKPETPTDTPPAGE